MCWANGCVGRQMSSNLFVVKSYPLRKQIFPNFAQRKDFRKKGYRKKGEGTRKWKRSHKFKSLCRKKLSTGKAKFSQIPPKNSIPPLKNRFFVFSPFLPLKMDFFDKSPEVKKTHFSKRISFPREKLGKIP